MMPAEGAPPMLRRWRGTNCWFGRPYGPPIAFVLHTGAGGDSGTVAEFLNSASAWSAHYVAGLDGALECFVDPADRTWGNGILEPGHRWSAIAAACGTDGALNPNHITISCETEDDGQTNQEVTDAQYAAVLFAAAEAKARFPKSLRFLATHADISPQSRANCPGDRWLSSGRFEALARTLGLETVCL
jgi:N-acetyl-anhydromuramyl-L-alanine amidase AmpD